MLAMDTVDISLMERDILVIFAEVERSMHLELPFDIYIEIDKFLFTCDEKEAPQVLAVANGMGVLTWIIDNGRWDQAEYNLCFMAAIDTPDRRALICMLLDLLEPSSPTTFNSLINIIQVGHVAAAAEMLTIPWSEEDLGIFLLYVDMTRHFNIFEMLVNKATYISENLLRKSVVENNSDALCLLLEKRPWDKHTLGSCLNYAVSRRNEYMAYILLRAGANPFSLNIAQIRLDPILQDMMAILEQFMI